MDLYDEGFKIQDMIDSDMRSLRSELDDYLSNLSHTPESPVLSALPPVLPMDISDNTVDSELSDDGRAGWMNSSQMYNVSSDFDSISGLLVNPETAMPVPVTQLSTTITVSSPVSGTVNVTLTPSKGRTVADSELVKVPVQVISSATKVEPEDDCNQSRVNVAVAVPTAQSTSDATHIHQVLAFHKVTDVDGSPKPKSKQKQNSKLTLQQSSEESTYPKPAYSYSCLIAMALKNSKTGSLPVNEIYDFMTENFPYFKTAPNGWKNSVRHNLSLNKCFEKIEKPTGNGAQRKGYLWALNPAKVEKMEEELQKWSSRDPEAIRRSMANPDRLELIEKGELKNADNDAAVHDKAMKFENVEVKSSTSCLSTQLVSSDFSPLDEPVGMDSTLPDLDFQKGIWENLCDDRLQFISESPMNSSSPKHPGTTLTSAVDEDDDSSCAASPIDMPKSFIHATYINDCAEHTSSDGETKDHFKQQFERTAEEQSVVCDA